MTAGKWWQLEIAKSCQSCNSNNHVDSFSEAASNQHNNGAEQLSRDNQIHNNYLFSHKFTRESFLNIENNVNPKPATKRGLITLKW